MEPYILHWQVTKEEYQKVGSLALGRQLEAELRAQGRNPYVVAVGGSTPLGAGPQRGAAIKCSS